MRNLFSRIIKLPENPVNRFTLIAGLGVGLAATAFWASRPVETLINWIPDDSFYYFQPAAMMARGYVPSFDGVNPGNGFNPLWMWLLVPIFLLKTVDPWLPVQLALGLSGLIFVIASYLLFHVLRELGVNERVSALGAASFPLWPNCFVTVVDGETTPLNLLLLALLFLLTCRLLRDDHLSVKIGILWGGLGALAVLTRTENAALVGMTFLFYVAHKKRRLPWRGFKAALIVCAAFVAAWLLWNLSYSGKAFPTSGWAIPRVMRTTFFKNLADKMGVIRCALLLLSDLKSLYFDTSPLYLAIIAVYGVAVGYWLSGRPERKTNLSLLFVFLIFHLGLFVFHTGVRWYLRTWHIGSAYFINNIFFWLTAHLVVEKFKMRALPFLIFAGLLGMYAFSAWFTPAGPNYEHQQEFLACGRWAAANPHLKIGTINGGIASYFSAGNVVNLDGNMNVAAYDAVKERRLYSYCKEENITYIVDIYMWVTDYFRPFWPANKVKNLEVVDARFDRTTPRVAAWGPYTVFRVK